jgi:hypothetical protein
MAEYRYVLYDTADFGTTANVNHLLFQIAEGADANHSEVRCNMRGNGVLPSEETFTVEKIHVWANSELPEADIQKLVDGTLLEVRVSDKTVLKIPLRLAASHMGYGGHYTQASGAARTVIGLMGEGFNLPENITINGGVRFSVRAYQRLAMTAAEEVVVALEGVLSTP